MALKQLFTDLAKGKGSLPIPTTLNPSSAIQNYALEQIPIVPGKYTTRLRFGGVDATDAPNKGFSGYSIWSSEPFIKVQPPEFNSETLQNNNFDINTDSINNLSRTNLNLNGADSRLNLITTFVNGSVEGLVRGGAITALQRRAIDAVRIGKFLASPRGIQFVFNQQLLEKINWNGQFDDGRPTYNPLNTLSQVALMPQGFGGRGFKRTGFLERGGSFLGEPIEYYTKIRTSDEDKVKLSLGYENKFQFSLSPSLTSEGSINLPKARLGINQDYFSNNNKSFSFDRILGFTIPQKEITSKFSLPIDVGEITNQGEFDQLILTDFDGFKLSRDNAKLGIGHPYFSENTEENFNLLKVVAKKGPILTEGNTKSKFSISGTDIGEITNDDQLKESLLRTFDGFDNFNKNHTDKKWEFKPSDSFIFPNKSTKLNLSPDIKDPFRNDEGKQLLTKTFDGFGLGRDDAKLGIDQGYFSDDNKDLKSNPNNFISDKTNSDLDTNINIEDPFRDEGSQLLNQTFKGFNNIDSTHLSIDRIEPKYLSTSQIYKETYKDNSVVIRNYRIGDPDYSTSYLLSANTKRRIDELNFIDITQQPDQDFRRKDLIKFRFSDISNEIEGQTNYLYFRANVTNISDGYKPEWDSYSYVGRGEKFYTYKGFDRTFSFNFTVFAMSNQEMKYIWRKLNYLASNTAPDYSNNGRLRGPLMRLTIGDYLHNQPGFLESLTFTINDNYPWDIGVVSEDNEQEIPTISTERPNNIDYYYKRSSGFQMPMGIDVQVSYRIIPDYLPERALPGNDNRFIKLKNSKRRDWWESTDIPIPIIPDTTPDTEDTSIFSDIGQNTVDFVTSDINGNDNSGPRFLAPITLTSRTLGNPVVVPLSSGIPGGLVLPPPPIFESNF